MKIEGKKFLVTGAGSGIGRELTLGLISRNAQVIAVDLNQAGLEETKKLAGEGMSRIVMYALNVADKSAIESLAKKVGDIDGLINNAGIIQPFVRVNDLSYEAIEKVMNVNFYGPLYLIKTFLPQLLTRPEACIVNVSSMGGFLPVPGQSVYGASKAALKLLTEGLSSELADTNVHVSVVFPGATQTNITKNSGVKAPAVSQADTKKFKSLPPKEAADIIIRGIENNTVRIFVGKDSKMMNRLYRLSPGFATNLITKQMKSLLS